MVAAAGYQHRDPSGTLVPAKNEIGSGSNLRKGFAADRQGGRLGVAGAAVPLIPEWLSVGRTARVDPSKFIGDCCRAHCCRILRDRVQTFSAALKGLNRQRHSVGDSAADEAAKTMG